MTLDLITEQRRAEIARRLEQDLEIPAFLRRDRLMDDQLRALVRPHGEGRQWIMPDMSKYRGDDDVARIDFHIENRDAPITVHRQRGSEPEVFHEFPDAETFEAWYRPAKFRFLGRSTGPSGTDVLLDIPRDAPRPASAAPSTGVPSSRATGEPSTSRPARRRSEGPPRPVEELSGETVQRGQRYIDSRHIAALEAAGLENMGTWPIKFRHGKTVIDFEPPPAGRRWATTWSVNGQSGRGVATLFKALGIGDS